MHNKFEGLGLEAIAHQSDSILHESLTSILRRANGVSDESEWGSLIQEMEKVILTRLDATVKIALVNTPAEFSGVPPVLTRNNALFYTATPSTDKEFIDYAHPFRGVLEGGVDRAKSKLLGDFRKAPGRIGLPVQALRGEIATPEEWAAGLIHELGHIFAYLEYVDLLTATNMVLLEVARVWSGNYPAKTRAAVIDSIEKATGGKVEDKEALIANDDFMAAEGAITNLAFKRIRNELGIESYDHRMMEFLADQFCARHNCARYQVQLLDKLERSASWLFKDWQYCSTSSMVLWNAIDLLQLMTANYAGAMVGRLMAGKAVINTSVKGVNALTDLMVMPMVDTLLISVLGKYKRYDSPEDRYAALRQEVVASLKNRDLSKEYIAARLQEIEGIDDLIGRLNKLPTLTRAFSKYVASSILGVRQTFRIQKEYEKLANNDIYYRAAQLDNMKV